MRSFIFCTSFISNQNYNLSSARWKRWRQFYYERKQLFGAERLFLIDDASPVENIPADVHVIDAEGPLPDSVPDGPVMFRFKQHYGRYSMTIFPGWWRSFTFSSQIAKQYSFSKIIHCESDAFIITGNLTNYVKQIEAGWVSFWCPRFNFPESAIQIICRDSFPNLEMFYLYGKQLWIQGVFPEKIFPFTRIEQNFTGDRYGEYMDDYPSNADYVCQSTERMTFDHQLKIS